MAVKAVIPICDIKENNLGQLDRLLSSPCFPGGFDEVLCLYDACDEAFIEYFEEKYPFTTTMANNKNRLNFAKNSNRGLRKCIEDKCGALLINMDCILPDWESISKLFIGFSTAQAQGSMDLPPGSGEATIIKDKFPFYCTHIPYEVLEKVGILDGVYIASAEDDDYIARAYLAGFEAYTIDCPIYHEGSLIDGTKEGWESASGAYNAASLDKSISRYYNKYRIPREIEHSQALQWILNNHKWKGEMKIT